MVTLLFTSVLILALAAIAIYFWQKPANSIESEELPPAIPPRALFSEVQPATDLTPSEQNGHQELIERATAGDLSALTEARDFEVYPEVMGAAVSEATSEAKLLRLASHVAQNRLPVIRSLAVAMMNAWQNSPNRQSTAKALHFAALADDAELYRTGVEEALRFWREGKLTDVSAMELQALLNGEYWLLSARVRNSGPGFVLKSTLSSARRELEGTTTN